MKKQPIYYSDIIDEAVRTFPKGTPEEFEGQHELEAMQREQRRAKWAEEAKDFFYGEGFDAYTAEIRRQVEAKRQAATATRREV